MGPEKSPYFVIKLRFPGKSRSRHLIDISGGKTVVEYQNTQYESLTNGATRRLIATATAVGASAYSSLIASRFVDLLVELTTDALARHNELCVIECGG